MKQTFYFLTLAAVLLSFSILVPAQSPTRILKQASKTLGDEKVLQATKSFQKTGTILRLKDGATGNFLTQGTQPNLYNTSYDLNGFETESGFNGKSGWTRDSRKGLRTLTGSASRDFQTEAFFRNNLWLKYKKEKAKIAPAGQEGVNGKSANVLIYTTAKGVTIKLFFDAATNLLLREEIPFGAVTKISDYADYRKVDGINEPFLIKQKIGEDAYEIKLNQITHNRQIASAEFDFPKTSGEPLPDIHALLTALQANEDKVDGILENYSYTQRVGSRSPDDDGVLRETSSQTFQISFYKGYQMTRLVERQDKSLTANEQADEDKKVAKRVAEIERKIAKREAKAASQTAEQALEDEDKRISTAELLRASNLINPRRENFRGREVIVFDFEPNPNFDYKNAKSFLKFFGKMAGVMWIDVQDKQVARSEAVLADSYKVGGGVLASLKKGASFALEQERVDNEIWLPSVADINLSVKLLLVKGINFNIIIKAYNYRKFTTEVKGSKVDEIKQP
jgi:hypothetical protein